MGNIPTLQEVKEYFKNADKVQDHKRDKGFVELEKIEYCAGCFIQNAFKDNWVVLYHNKKGYAKIITRKEPTYTITKEQLLELENGFTLPKLKEWFPDVFEVKLEDGKWYKVEDLTNGSLGFNGLGQYTLEKNRHGLCDDDKGFNFKQADGTIWRTNGKIKESTEQEVFEALKNEAVKRGFKEGAYAKRTQEMLYERGTPIAKEEVLIENNVFIFSLEENYISIDGRVIFSNGKWAEIIPTLTKKEAEEKLNCKIV